MDRSLAMLLLLGSLVLMTLLFLALFAMAPIFWSCMASLLYTLCIFLFNESHNVHNAQEFENRFWTIFAILFSTALFFAKDSPLALGIWNPNLGALSVILCGYAMHVWDRNIHRLEVGRSIILKRGTATTSLVRLGEAGVPVENLKERINNCLSDLDQTYIPSTINNWFYKNFVIRNEREILSTLEEAEPRVLNYLICNTKLGLIFYKVKDHRSFKHQHRTKLIELLAFDRISHLTVHSRVIVLHALQTLKLPANVRAEHCVENIILNTKLDALSELKTLMDAKGDYWCMNKLIYDDIKSDIIRKNILDHIQRQARVQYNHMAFNTRKAKDRKSKFWRKVLSDVDDTLVCSGGSYPSGIDKRYGKKVMYPGVLGFYRELDLGIDGAEEWPSHTVGNLVFLSARPHLFKDMSEKINFAKFQKLQNRGMHTVPSLLPGDIRSGVDTLVTNDFEPLARKKFENFQQYVSIYPEFRHVFVCDNGQGDVMAAELMVEAFPKQVEAIYVHQVQEISKTYKYDPESWKTKPVKPIFFKNYPEAALHAASRTPPLLRISGLRRICIDAINDFYMIQTNEWKSQLQKWDRHDEINQSLFRCNKFLSAHGEDCVPLLEAKRLWKDGQKVTTPYGSGRVCSFDPTSDMYGIELDWRLLDAQMEEYEEEEMKEMKRKMSVKSVSPKPAESRSQPLETVFEADEEMSQSKLSTARSSDTSLIPDDEGAIITSARSPGILEDGDAPDSSTEPALGLEKDNEARKRFIALAKIRSRYIIKYIPPSLPIFASDDDAKSTFSFWSSRTESTKPKALFNKDDKCNTPYGCGTVIEYRENTGIVVISLSNWSGVCYLNAESVKIVSEGFFNSILRIFSEESKQPALQPISPSKKELQFPYAKNSSVVTPFGEGAVIRPLQRRFSENIATDKIKTQSISSDTNTDRSSEVETIAIRLSSWRLADGSCAMLYCTAESALDWKGIGDEERSKGSGGILSTFGSIVSQSVKNLIVGKPKKKTSKIPSEITVHLFERFYEDGAAVKTPFGVGVVTAFRETDGMYIVTLYRWKMANGTCPKIYLQKGSLSCLIARNCIEGYPVLTSLGMSGTLISIQPKTGVHVVAVSTAGMVCYLQPKDVLCPLKAAVGEGVLTPYGEGTVVKFRPSDETYEISLLGWGAKLFARAESFDRDNTRTFEEKGGFGISRVFRLLFSADSINSLRGTGAPGGSQRSRSNSLASVSTKFTLNI